MKSQVRSTGCTGIAASAREERAGEKSEIVVVVGGQRLNYRRFRPTAIAEIARLSRVRSRARTGVNLAIEMPVCGLEEGRVWPGERGRSSRKATVLGYGGWIFPGGGGA